MNALLQSVCDQACSDLAAQFREASDELLASIHKAEAEAQLQESPMKFNIGFKISLDLDKSVVTNSLSWSVKRSLETSHQIEDPLQAKLPLNSGVLDSAAKLADLGGEIGGSMTISAGDASVTLNKDWARILKQAAAKMRMNGK